MPTEKHALVTVGATAPFPRLIQQLLTPSVLTTLTSLNYTHLTIQHGLTPTNYGGTSDGESLLATLNTFTPPFTSPTSSSTSLNIASFPFSDSLQDEMAKSDLVISHAGSGSILDALRMTKKLIVVPNEELMDNHQKELARELERQGYLVDSTPEYAYILTPPHFPFDSIALERFFLMG